jgi:hypothetical protein
MCFIVFRFRGGEMVEYPVEKGDIDQTNAVRDARLDFLLTIVNWGTR